MRAWAEATGAAVLKLAVLPGNDAAAELYLKNGFVLTDEPGELLADGVTRENVMVRALRG